MNRDPKIYGITWKEYVDLRFIHHIREHSLITTALEKAETSVDKRLEGMNEFRHQIERLESTFATRDMIAQLERQMQKYATSEMLTQVLDFQHQWGRQIVTFAPKDMLITLEKQVEKCATLEALTPLLAFQNRFWGFVAAFTIINGLITTFIYLLTKKP